MFFSHFGDFLLVVFRLFHPQGEIPPITHENRWNVHYFALFRVGKVQYVFGNTLNILILLNTLTYYTLIITPTTLRCTETVDSFGIYSEAKSFFRNEKLLCAAVRFVSLFSQHRLRRTPFWSLHYWFAQLLWCLFCLSYAGIMRYTQLLELRGYWKNICQTLILPPIQFRV